MTNYKWLTLPLVLLAGVTIATSSAQAEGDKKNRLCRHLKMIYLLNSGSNGASADEIKEKYGEMACGQMSFSLEGSSRGNNPDSSPREVVTAVTRTPDEDPPKPTDDAIQTAQ